MVAGGAQAAGPNFNPLFPYGKRLPLAYAYRVSAGFQSTLPIREETSITVPARDGLKFQSTLPIREETEPDGDEPTAGRISIHSSHTGRDLIGRKCRPVCNIFQSTLPIREETRSKRAYFMGSKFQSTLPIREETIRRSSTPSPHGNFNPLFPYGKRRPTDAVLEELQKISIHSSHTGRDTEATRQALAEGFQSTLPIREETRKDGPRMKHIEFQSTLPIREETVLAASAAALALISIHSSHTGRDGMTAANMI